jgi:hypothetical protein
MLQMAILRQESSDPFPDNLLLATLALPWAARELA